jgi:hypothetical protein
MGIGHPSFGIEFGVLTAFAMSITQELGFGTKTYRAYQKP